MADRVHPSHSPSTANHASTSSSPNLQTPLQPTKSVPEKPAPPQPGTYVIQIPKDIIYRIPPPENARRYERLTRRQTRRNPCCCCLCWLIGLIFVLSFLVALTAGIFYLVFRPETPNYSVNDISITGFNLSSSKLSISPQFDVAIRADNPNDKIGIYYKKGSSVTVYHSDVKLSNGVVPAFYQPSNNVTVFHTELSGSGIVLGNTVHEELVNQVKQGKILFRLRLKAPVRIKVGSVKSWTITVKVSCDVTVDKLTAESKILSKDCDLSVKLW